MKHAFLFLIAGFILTIDAYSQEKNDSYLIGASLSYTHDDLQNNSSLNSNSYSNYQSNTLSISSEFLYFLTAGSLLGIEIVYTSNSLNIVNINTSDRTNISTGISINPKYRFMKELTEKIWFFTDCRTIMRYSNIESTYAQLDYQTYEYNYISTKGMELKFGLAIDAGILVKIKQGIGITFDYTLANVLYSSVIQKESSDTDFDSYSAWDYGLNMKMTGLNLGIVFTF